MKAVIPLAGKGTRLRPQTYHTPKPLLRVGGRPVMSYILDDLQALGIEEVIFVIGYLGEVVKDYMAQHYPHIRARYVVQEVQDGTAGAVRLTRPYVDEEILIVFVDTLFEADLGLISTLGSEWAGIIWAKEVDDYQRFGVVVTDLNRAMVRIVEKPREPISRLANIGLYYIRDHELLFRGIEHTLAQPPGPGGEFFLTDAFQFMVDHGARIFTAPVQGWFDCGKPETLLATNEHLLLKGRAGVALSSSLKGVRLHEPVRIEEGAGVENSTLGPNVTVGEGALVRGSSIRNSLIGPGALVEGCALRDSLVGGHAVVRNFQGKVSLADHSSVEG